MPCDTRPASTDPTAMPIPVQPSKMLVRVSLSSNWIFPNELTAGKATPDTSQKMLEANTAPNSGRSRDNI